VVFHSVAQQLTRRSTSRGPFAVAELLVVIIDWKVWLWRGS